MLDVVLIAVGYWKERIAGSESRTVGPTLPGVTLISVSYRRESPITKENNSHCLKLIQGIFATVFDFSYFLLLYFDIFFWLVIIIDIVYLQFIFLFLLLCTFWIYN